MYTLFLDDERPIPWWLTAEPIVLVRDFDEFKEAIETHGLPATLSFDHDLGKSKDGVIKPTGFDALKWLIDAHLDGHLDLSKVKWLYVHSMNPQGVANICGLWNNFAEHIESPVRAVRRECGKPRPDNLCVW